VLASAVETLQGLEVFRQKIPAATPSLCAYLNQRKITLSNLHFAGAKLLLLTAVPALLQV